MPEFVTTDPELQVYLDRYSAATSASEDIMYVPDPQQRPVPGVEYDEQGLPTMPSDLTALPSHELGRLFQAVEAWHEYLSGLLTDSEINYYIESEKRALARAFVKKDMRGKGMAQKDADEAFRTDPRYINANELYLSSRVTKSRIENVYSRLSKRFQLISREISRRSGELPSGDLDRRYQQSRGSDQTSRPEYDEDGALLSDPEEFESRPTGRRL